MVITSIHFDKTRQVTFILYKLGKVKDIPNDYEPPNKTQLNTCLDYAWSQAFHIHVEGVDIHWLSNPTDKSGKLQKLTSGFHDPR